jgi:hypothetical protein
MQTKTAVGFQALLNVSMICPHPLAPSPWGEGELDSGSRSLGLLCTHKSFQPPKSPILGDFELNPDKAFGEIGASEESSFSMGSIKSQRICGTTPQSNRFCSKSPILGDLGGEKD